MERYYNIVYDQQFSPSGKFLATCDTFGRIAVFSLQSALNHSSTTDGKIPLRVKQIQDGPVYSLASAGPLLASGGCDDIKLWRWEELVSASKDPQPVCVLTPTLSGRSGTTDTNSLVYDKEASTLYAGGGDNTVQAWDVSTETLKREFSGHSGYVHTVCVRSGGNILSGAEDGTVKMWDPSSSHNPVHTWKPAKSSGQWVGCVAVDAGGDWMVCAGSMAPSIYRLTSNNKIASLPVPPHVATQAAIFTKDRIITAGSEPTIRHWSVNGEALAAVPGGHQHNFSLEHNTRHKSKQYEVLTVCGDSSDVHVFTDFGYRAFSLNIT